MTSKNLGRLLLGAALIPLVTGEDDLTAEAGDPVYDCHLGPSSRRNSIPTGDLLVEMTADERLTHRSQLCSSCTDEFRGETES